MKRHETIINLDELEFHEWSNGERFGGRMGEIAQAVGASKLGYNRFPIRQGDVIKTTILEQTPIISRICVHSGTHFRLKSGIIFFFQELRRSSSYRIQYDDIRLFPLESIH